MFKNGSAQLIKRFLAFYFYFMILACLTHCGISRPMEPDYDKNEDIIVTPSMNIESEPALIMLRHMWQSIQELKRRQIEDEIPSFGQGIAQQLDVLRKLNRRQTQKRKIIDLIQDSKTLDTVLQKAFENVDDIFPTGSNVNFDSRFPSKNEEMEEFEKLKE